MHPLDHPALVALADGKLVRSGSASGGRLAGVLSYVVEGTSCEILTLHAGVQWHGVGTALVTAVGRIAGRPSGLEHGGEAQ